METKPGNAIDTTELDKAGLAKMERTESSIENKGMTPEQMDVKYEAPRPLDNKGEEDQRIEALHSKLLAEQITPKSKTAVEAAIPQSVPSETKVTKGEAARAIGVTGATIALASISIPAIAADLAAGSLTSFAAAGPAIYLAAGTVLCVIVSGITLYQVGKKVFVKRSPGFGTPVAA